MPRDINQIEEERAGRLNQARKIKGLIQGAANAAGMPGLPGLAEDFSKVAASHIDPRPVMHLAVRLGKYLPILIIAAIFDLFALIPFVSVVVNFCFGIVMFLYFGRKKVVVGIIAPIVIGSIVDFLISLLPVNLAAAAIRIALKEITE